MLIPEFPDFVPISYDLRNEMHPQLPMTVDGVSEYTFANLYLFRRRYRYRVSRIQDKTLIISGIQPAGQPNKKEKTFFCTPCAVPGRGILEELFKNHGYWKGISDSLLTPSRDRMEKWGLKFSEDRDNFDYLYLRTDLAELPGKKYHKKRNLVSQFNHNYGNWEAKPLSAELISPALEILEKWREQKGFDGDFLAATEALQQFKGLFLQGMVYWVEGKLAAWCLGERLARGRMFAVHFEKALEEFKGIYQFVNQHYASTLPNHYIHINREQDLGDQGLRQAKMTYRPCGFVRKFTAAMAGEVSF
ncbi:MAG: phosphatidylglycerol lysyltransferase domain-containing protein [Treponema sp.]|nr:phosphatidylglycerol lysyltransferase domain-containing protein [Treponema sp.]